MTFWSALVYLHEYHEKTFLFFLHNEFCSNSEFFFKEAFSF